MPENHLREIRINQGLTQVELARRIKMSPQNLSNIENGRLLPWAKIKKKLARALKTSEVELFPTVSQEAAKNGQ